MKILGILISHSPPGYNKSDDPVTVYNQWEHQKWLWHLQTYNAHCRHTDNPPDYIRIIKLEREVQSLKMEQPPEVKEEAKPWRSVDWDVEKIRLDTHERGRFADNDLVEAGADAMLKAVREKNLCNLKDGDKVEIYRILKKGGPFHKLGDLTIGSDHMDLIVLPGGKQV